MIKKSNFYEELYFGIGAEHYVMADFIMRGYEAVKISPDFGYDINVTNKYKVINKEDEEPISYYLQVKSRLINPTASNKEVRFYLLETDLERMINDEKSFLVLVLVQGEIPYDSFSEDVMQTFDMNGMSGGQYKLSKREYPHYKVHSNVWFSSSDLKILEERGYFSSETKGDSIYRFLTLDFAAHYILVGNKKEVGSLGDSRRYLFCITKRFFGYQHNTLFI